MHIYRLSVSNNRSFYCTQIDGSVFCASLWGIACLLAGDTCSEWCGAGKTQTVLSKFVSCMDGSVGASFIFQMKVHCKTLAQ